MHVSALRFRTIFEPHDGPLQEVVDRLAQIPFEFQPGQHWNYGVSFDVPGRVVEVASGKPLDVFFKGHIFEPLGMKDTGFAALYKHTDENDLTLLEAPPSQFNNRCYNDFCSIRRIVYHNSLGFNLCSIAISKQ
ncbi:MAG: serine hydrolase domain-containing protein [Desulfobacterales bacterium]